MNLLWIVKNYLKLELHWTRESLLLFYFQDFEDTLQSFDSKLTTVQDKSKNIEVVVSNGNQLQDGVKTLQVIFFHIVFL